MNNGPPEVLHRKQASSDALRLGHRTPETALDRISATRPYARNAQVLADCSRSLCAVDAERELEIFSERASAPVQAMPVEASSDR